MGRRLFKVEEDVETIRKIMMADVPDPTTLVEGYPPALAKSLLHALARDPAERYATAADFARDLDACITGDGAKETADAMRALYPPDRQRAPWEIAVESVTPTQGEGALLAWDDDRQKMTWMQMEPSGVGAPSGASGAPRTDRASLLEALAAHAGTVGDALASARVKLEMAIVEEVLGEATRAAAHAQEALSIDGGLTAAHAILRRTAYPREAAKLLVHLDAELAAATTEPARADLLAERARLLEASKGDAIGAWDRVLALAPEHAAALTGLEAAYGSEHPEARAAHLARMAQAYANEPKLSAWLHVERAEILDATGDEEAARGALARALSLDGGLGPVRDACVRHATIHGDAPSLVDMLDAEALLEGDAARAAQLELDAACIARWRLQDTKRALTLLTRAAARAATPMVERRILDDLVRLHEAAQSWTEARAVRHARLRLISEPRARVHELRHAAALAERIGDAAAAMADIEEARTVDPEDASLLAMADRLSMQDTLKREALWQAEATRGDSAKRARASLRAAEIAEGDGRSGRAIEHLRAALAAAPKDAEIADRLAESLSASPIDAAARTGDRVAVYVNAAARAADPARRIAYLERAALLWEEVAGDAGRAAAAYEEVLSIDKTRRTAVMGLARTARRQGDKAKLARALLDEASASESPEAADDLRVRAADALSTIDADRARQVAESVLASKPAHDAARALVIRVHEQAARWEQVDRAIEARIEHTSDAAAKASMWIARAELQRTRLGSPEDARKSLETARALDPSRPAMADEIALLVESRGDAKALRACLADLARDARDDEKAQLLVRAGELDELVSLDDEAAAKTYAAALAAKPEDAFIADRLTRVDARRARKGVKIATSEHAPLPTPQSVFARARTAIDAGELEEAATLLDSLSTEEASRPHVLRAMQAIARAKKSAPLLANVFEQEASAFTADAPVLGALWGEAAIVEWHLPESHGTEIYERILARAPADRAALDGLARRALLGARAGETNARAKAVRALDALAMHAPDDSARLALQLAMALLLDPAENTDDPHTRSALDHYRQALRIDPRSLTAATGAARLATPMKDTEAAIAAACARAELTTDMRARAVLLVQAAGQLLAPERASTLGTVAERRARAADLLERALQADPGSASAAGVLTTLLTEEGDRGRLLHALRTALDRAERRDAIVLLGMDLARVARTEPADPALAVTALSRVRAAAPEHTPALLALADAHAAQNAWPEAIEALEAAVTHAGDLLTKHRALAGLADLYARVADGGADVERVTRAILAIDPRDARALQTLLDRLRSPDRTDAPETLGEIADVLSRLAEVASSSEAKTAALIDLVDVRLELGDRPAAEQALIEAAAHSPGPQMLARIAALTGAAPQTPADHARALSALVARSTQLGRPDPMGLLTLAHLEIDVLARPTDGVAHARSAVALMPAHSEARALLAKGLAQTGTPAEAVSAILSLMDPDATPLLGLREPDASLAVLERALHDAHREQESLVAREIRAVGGAIDEASTASLRSRRLKRAEIDGGPATLERATLRARVIPPEGRHVLLDVAGALAGTEAKLFVDDLSELGLGARDRVPNGHPLRAAFDRARRALGVEEAELLMVDEVTHVRITGRGVPWIVAPRALGAMPEPIQVAAMARVLTRVALGVPWIEQLPAPHVRALLTAGARLAVPEYASELRDPALDDMVADYMQRLGKAASRKQKKALSSLESELQASRGASPAEIDALMLAVARTEFRVAFLLTGDLLATFDELRAADGDFARALTGRSPAALAAILTHPLASDTTRFALSPAATTLRREAGTIWPASS